MLWMGVTPLLDSIADYTDIHRLSRPSNGTEAGYARLDGCIQLVQSIYEKW